MSTPSDAVRAFIAPLLPGWRVQLGRWMDGNRLDRYAVIRPAGGLPISLVREPQFTLYLVGAENDDTTLVAEAAESILEAMRSSSGSLVFMQPAEPVFVATDDGRPGFEIAMSAIVN